MTFRPSAQALVWFRVDELNATSPFDRVVSAQARASTSRGVATMPATATATQLANPSAALSEVAESKMQLIEDRRSGAISDTEFDVAFRSLEARREMLLQEQASPANQPRPWALLGSSPDDSFGRFGIQPISVEIQKNGFRAADTATMTVDWRTIPFDPRIIRSAAVEIVVGVVDQDDFARGMAGVVDPFSGLPISIIGQNPGSPSPTSSTRFSGWVDEWGIVFDEESKVDLKMRDFTSLFLDTPLDPAATINPNLPVDKAISGMLSNYPTLAGFPVNYVADPDREGNAPAPSLGSGVPATRRARRGRGGNTPRSGDQRMNLWDHITDVCVSLGLVPTVRGYQLDIVEPTTQYTTKNTRRMIYGRNLSKLEYSRKLGGVKVPTIEVRAYDPTIGRIRWARWPFLATEHGAGVLGVTRPPLPMRADSITPSGLRVEERVQTFVVKPTTDVATMIRAARAIFEQIGRQEVEGSFETNDVSSWDIQNDRVRPEELADLLQLAPGDALELLVAASNPRRPEEMATTQTDWIAMERSARSDYLVTMGMNRTLANRIASLQDVVSTMLFRTQEVTIKFSNETGIGITVSFANFLEARETRSAGDRQIGAFLNGTPSAQAEAVARNNAGFPALLQGVIATSEERSAAFEAATTVTDSSGLPAAPGAEEVARVNASVANEIATNGLGGDS